MSEPLRLIQTFGRSIRLIVRLPSESNFFASTRPATALCVCVCCILCVCDCVMVIRVPHAQIMQHTHTHKAYIFLQLPNISQVYEAVDKVSHPRTQKRWRQRGSNSRSSDLEPCIVSVDYMCSYCMMEVEDLKWNVLPFQKMFVKKSKTVCVIFDTRIFQTLKMNLGNEKNRQL